MSPRSIERPLPALLLALLLSACGGGGGDSPPPVVPPPVTPPTVPLSVELQMPERTEAGEALSLSPRLAGATGALSYQWDFGDGQRSSEAQPSHRYEKPGRYTVNLTVRNGLGGTATAQRSLQVGFYKRLQGRECSGPQLSGWCWMQPGQAARALGSPQLVDELTAVAGGEQGLVVRSTDGGRSWTPLAGPGDHRLLELRTHGTELLAVDEDMQLHRRSPGGERWSSEHRLPLQALQQLWWYGGTRIWVNGVADNANGVREKKSLISTDGGRTWRPLAMEIQHVEANGWIWSREIADCCESSNPWAWLSRDEGLTFGRLPLPADQLMLGLHVASNGTIRRISYKPSAPWSVENLLLEVSHDAGRSFQPLQMEWQSTPPHVSLVEVKFDDSGHALGLLRGESYTQYWLASSPGGGQHWALLPDPIFTGFLGSNMAVTSPRLLGTRGVQVQHVVRGVPLPSDRMVLHDTSGRVVSLQAPGETELPAEIKAWGANGLLLGYGHWKVRRWVATPDSGKTWQPLPGYAGPENQQAQALSLWFFNARQGLRLDSDGQLWRTEDSGRNWQPQQNLDPGDSGALQFVAGGLGWAGTHRLWRTRDGGKNWERLDGVLGQIVQSHLLDTGHGWVEVKRPCNFDFGCPGNQLLRTTDAGSTWTVVSTFASFVVLGPENLLSVWGRSDDGGKSWQSEPNGLGHLEEPLLRRDPQGQIWLLDRSANSRLWRSTDQGRSWQQVPLPADLPQARDLHWAAGGAGWIVGDRGLILATRDGGLTWRRQNSHTSRALHQAFALDAETLWVLGESSAVLSSASGGE